jgi:hypothetical protein
LVPTDPRPAELDAVEGKPPPPGYLEKSKIRKGFVIPGAITFGVTYGMSLLLSTNGSDDPDHADRWLALPVLGPVIWGYRDECSYDDDLCGNPFTGWILGIGQAAGLTLFVWGIWSRDKYWRRADLARSVTMVPMLIGRRAPGVGVTGRL